MEGGGVATVQSVKILQHASVWYGAALLSGTIVASHTYVDPFTAWQSPRVNGQ